MQCHAVHVPLSLLLSPYQILSCTILAYDLRKWFLHPFSCFLWMKIIFFHSFDVLLLSFFSRVFALLSQITLERERERVNKKPDNMGHMVKTFNLLAFIHPLTVKRGLMRHIES